MTNTQTIRRLRAVALVFLSFTVAPATASATDWIPIFDQASIQYWGGGQLPPCGQPRYVWGDTPPGSGAMASAETCLITWSREQWAKFSADPTAMCVETVHEIGHLYGHQHDEGGVMAASTSMYALWRVLPPCATTIVIRQSCRTRRHGSETSSECHQTLRPRRRTA